MKLKLTEAKCRDLPIGEHQDETEPSLRFYVTETARTFGLYKWSPLTQKPVRRSLGKWPTVTVDEARKRAKTMASTLGRGESLTKIEVVPTLRALVDAYESKLRGEKAKRPKAPSTHADRYFKHWLGRPVSEITKAEVAELHTKLVKDAGPHAAARAVKTLRSLFSYADDMDLYSGPNVAKAVKYKDDTPRKRTLSADEQARLMKALRDPSFGEWVFPYFRLLMLTGVRRGNLSAAKWSDINLEAGMWLVPADDAKMGEMMEVVLVPEAVELFQKQAGKHATWVFPSNRRSASGHVSTGVWDIFQDALKLAAIEGVTPHDLRRTFGSDLIASKVPLPIVAKAMGHRDPATTARHYSVVSTQTVRDALMGNL